MKILILAEHWAVASGRYCLDALKRMGHEVKSAGEPHGAEIWDGTVDERYIWEPDELDETWKPDLVLIMDGNMPPTIRDSYPSARWVVYGVDNHVRDYRQYDVDHLFLAHSTGQRMNEENVTWLPCGYDPGHFAPSKIPWGERQIDAALVGVLYGKRGEVLYGLREDNPAIKMVYGTGAIYEQYAEIYHNTRLSLVWSANQDVAQRVWETAAMGCLVVKDANPDDEKLGLEHMKNCLIARTTQAMVQLVRWSMANPDEAEKIAKAGQKWAKLSTWDARLQVILDWVETQRKPKKHDADSD